MTKSPIRQTCGAWGSSPICCEFRENVVSMGLGLVAGQLGPNLALGACWGGSPLSIPPGRGLLGCGVPQRTKRGELCAHFVDGEMKAPKGTVS